ncbi:hypothetical protein Tco_0095235, partial [Tanacetum coccineum]
DDPQKALKNKGIVDSGCSRHMTGNKAYLVEYQDYNGGPVAFGEEVMTEGRQSKETEEQNVTHDTEVLEKGGSNEEPVNVVDEDTFLADALVMLSDKAKFKGVEIKEMKDAERTARLVLTLKPLPKIDPKDKGKGVLEE